MKLIEAMKRVKMNEEKITDLQAKILAHSAHLSVETPLYPEPRKKIEEWSQTCVDLTQECVRLLCAIQRTNLATLVTIELAIETKATHNIAEWVWRRRKYAAIDGKTFGQMNDRNLKEGTWATTVAGQPPMAVTIVRNYDPGLRDTKQLMFKAEPHLIDATLEIVNATTDLIE